MISAAALAVAFSGASATGGVEPLLVDFGRWFAMGELQVRWSFVLDGLSLPMAALVLTVSCVTQRYSYWYLASDPGLVRFQAYLNLFTFSMLLLVFADNLVILFLGWEGIGLCSYLLIGFWHTRPEARMAALKAVSVNRIGDAALLAAMGLLFSLSGSLELAANAALLPAFAGVALPGVGGVGPLALAVGLVLVGLAAKSAQLGLHIWLLDAMEGPTPVSALIHAATLVTAGIYLALRLTPLLGLVPEARSALAVLGAASALFGAAAACFQWDVKKMIAFSTMSQMGVCTNKTYRRAEGTDIPALVSTTANRGGGLPPTGRRETSSTAPSPWGGGIRPRVATRACIGCCRPVEDRPPKAESRSETRTTCSPAGASRTWGARASSTVEANEPGLTCGVLVTPGGRKRTSFSGGNPADSPSAGESGSPEPTLIGDLLDRGRSKHAGGCEDAFEAGTKGVSQGASARGLGQHGTPGRNSVKGFATLLWGSKPPRSSVGASRLEEAARSKGAGVRSNRSLSTGPKGVGDADGGADKAEADALTPGAESVVEEADHPGASAETFSSLKEPTPDNPLSQQLRTLERASRSADSEAVRSIVKELLASPSFYIYCYEAIRSNPGMMARGVAGDGSVAATLDRIDLDFFEKLAARISRGLFNWGPIRTVEIPKRAGGTRSLGISASRDKIVQKAMAVILEATAEHRFLDCSHGFRRGRSAHTALAYVKRHVGRGAWAVEGDISACFDSFDHRTLVALVKKHYVDHQIFLDLLRKALRVRVVTLTSATTARVGTPQGSVLSPILANVYLHELDRYVMEGGELEEYRGKKVRTPTWEYRKFTQLPEEVLKQAELLKKRSAKHVYWKFLHNARRKRRRWAWEEMNRRGRPQMTSPPEARRLVYVRYADDFVVFVGGTRKDAEEVRRRVGRFLKGTLGLRMSVEKTKVTHLRTEKAKFLGLLIWQPDFAWEAPVTTLNPLGQRVPDRGHKYAGSTRATPRLKITIPVLDILRSLTDKGLARRLANGTYRPTSFSKALGLNIPAIIRYLRSVFRGLALYYGVADDWYEAKHLYNYWGRYAAAMTIAHKTKSSTSKVMKRYGP